MTASGWDIILIFVISTSRMYGAGQAWNPLSKNLLINTWQLLAVPLLTPRCVEYTAEQKLNPIHIRLNGGGHKKARLSRAGGMKDRPGAN